jgi:hypothetical protein
LERALAASPSERSAPRRRLRTPQPPSDDEVERSISQTLTALVSLPEAYLVALGPEED